MTAAAATAPATVTADTTRVLDLSAPVTYTIPSRPLRKSTNTSKGTRSRSRTRIITAAAADTDVDREPALIAARERFVLAGLLTVLAALAYTISFWLAAADAITLPAAFLADVPSSSSTPSLGFTGELTTGAFCLVLLGGITAAALIGSLCFFIGYRVRRLFFTPGTVNRVDRWLFALAAAICLPGAIIAGQSHGAPPAAITGETRPRPTTPKTTSAASTTLPSIAAQVYQCEIHLDVVATPTPATATTAGDTTVFVIDTTPTAPATPTTTFAQGTVTLESSTADQEHLQLRFEFSGFTFTAAYPRQALDPGMGDFVGRTASITQSIIHNPEALGATPALQSLTTSPGAAMLRIDYYDPTTGEGNGQILPHGPVFTFGGRA